MTPAKTYRCSLSLNLDLVHPCRRSSSTRKCVVQIKVLELRSRKTHFHADCRPYAGQPIHLFFSFIFSIIHIKTSFFFFFLVTVSECHLLPITRVVQPSAQLHLGIKVLWNTSLLTQRRAEQGRSALVMGTCPPWPEDPLQATTIE